PGKRKRKRFAELLLVEGRKLDLKSSPLGFEWFYWGNRPPPSFLWERIQCFVVSKVVMCFWLFEPGGLLLAVASGAGGIPTLFRSIGFGRRRRHKNLLPSTVLLIIEGSITFARTGQRMTFPQL